MRVPAGTRITSRFSPGLLMGVAQMELSSARMPSKHLSTLYCHE